MTHFELVALRCPACGGDLEYVAGAPIASCPYCDARVAVVGTEVAARSVDGSTYRMQSFEVGPDRFVQAFLQFLSEGDYTPADVFELVKVRQNTGLFAATYLWTGTARVSWSASAGFERTESYVTTRTVTRNGQTVQEPTTSTRTVTDWRPVSGDLLHDYRLVGLASDGVPDEVAGLVRSIEGLPPVDQLAMVDPENTRGYAIEPFRDPPSKAFSRSAEGTLAEALEARVKAAVPGDTSKDIHVSHSRTNESVVRLLRPIWLAIYQYEGRSYAFALDGHTGTRSEGTRPEDTALRERVEALKKKLRIAHFVAIITGILSFFVAFLVGPVVVGAIWYAYTRGLKTELSLEQDRIDLAASARKAALEDAQRRATMHGPSRTNSP